MAPRTPLHSGPCTPDHLLTPNDEDNMRSCRARIRVGNEELSRRRLGINIKITKTTLHARQCTPKQFLAPKGEENVRARARAGHGGSIRYRSANFTKFGVGFYVTPVASRSLDVLAKSQLMELLAKCLQLDQENKITVRNTWELNLISHLGTLVYILEEEGHGLDFQKVSCILEAAAKIYSTRVDSVHTDGYKVLGTLNRTNVDMGVKSADHIRGEGEVEYEVNKEDREVLKQKTSDHSFSPENSVDPINEKLLKASTETMGKNTPDKAEKKDMVFKHVAAAHSITLEKMVGSLDIKQSEGKISNDPYIIQSLAQYFKGGAQSLLLNNLSVYMGCEIFFDPWEVPEKRMTTFLRNESERTLSVNLSFMHGAIQQMMVQLRRETSFSPSLKKIVEMLDDPYRAVAEAEASTNPSDVRDTDGPLFVEYQDAYDSISEVFDHEGDEVDPAPDLPEAADSNEDLKALILWDEEEIEVEDARRKGLLGQHCMAQNSPVIFLPLRSNEWPGAAHWKYRKKRAETQVTKSLENSTPATKSGKKESKESVKKSAKKEVQPTRQTALDFEHPQEVDYVAAFSLPCKMNSADLTPQKNAMRNLLQDVQFNAISLAHFFLRPSISCLLPSTRHFPGQEQTGDSLPHSASHGLEDEKRNEDFRASVDCKSGQSDLDDPFGDHLVQPAYKVEKIDLNFNSSCTIVDVHRLKESLWEVLQDIQELPCMNNTDDSDGTPFQEVLDILPVNCVEASTKDISVPICFMCLLHLANEHHLFIKDCPTKDDLRIFRADTEAPLMLAIVDI